jgi:hypothetical protein
MRLVVSSIFLLTVGCSAVVGSPEESDAQNTTVTGVVVVDRSVSDEASHAEASARFIRLRGAIDDSALRLVGAGLDLPSQGQCGVKRLLDGPSTRPVELLDVGAVSIEALSSGQHTALAPRQVPDVVDLVSGTMYSARVDESSTPSGSDVTILVGGSTDVPGFSVRAKTPDVPANVRVSMLDGANAEVTWTSSMSDGVYIDLGSARCSFADEGYAVVPVSEGDTIISLHRLHREKLSIPGLDAGELRFDFARSVTLRR